MASSSGAIRSALREASAAASRRNAGAISAISAASAASSMVTSLPSRTTGRPATNTVSTARAGLGEHDLPRRAVERHERRLVEIEDHQVGGHAGLERADPSCRGRPRVAPASVAARSA